MFSDSEAFHAVLERIASVDPDGKGSMRVGRIKLDEFAYFMNFMYRRFVILLSLDILLRKTRLIQAVWQGGPHHSWILGCSQVSTRWRFRTVRETAIREFPDVDVVDKIALARDCCVEQWLVPSLNTYARLERSVTLQDVNRLGLEYVLKIVQIRERLTQPIIRDGRTELEVRERLTQPIIRGGRTELEVRRDYDFWPSLEALFCEEINQSRIQFPSTSASDTEDLNLVEMYFLVSYPASCAKLRWHES
jgi:hypothetical protein